MSMHEEFQRRMKAEKDKERQRKTESAQMLQSYRGNVSEEEVLKLRALKEEERQRKMDAAEHLRGYRGGELTEEERKLKALREEERQKHLEAENLLHSYQKQDEPDAKRRITPRADGAVVVDAVTGPQEDTVLQDIASGSVSARAAAFNSPTAPVPMASPTRSSVPTVAAPTPDATSSSPVVATASTSTSVPELGGGVESLTVSEESTGATRAASVATPAASNLTAALQSSSPATPAAPSLNPASSCFDLFFSFGIVTESAKPDYSSYMHAVSEIVREALTGHPCVSYSLDRPPYVSEESWDDNFVDASARSEVRRVLVTTGVPLTLSPGTTTEAAQDVVTKALADAISSNRFLDLVRNGK